MLLTVSVILYKYKMRYYEFTNESIEPITEGGKSSGIRYNSEVGMLAGFMGVDVSTFDPKNPERTMDPDMLHEPERVYKDIKNLLAPNYDPVVFAKWASIGIRYQAAMIDPINMTDTTVTAYGWAGGSNKSDAGAVDISFIGCSITGVSIKAEGGITLANLTPKSLGLETERGIDTFSKYATIEFNDMKQAIFADVLDEAEAQPDQAIAPKDIAYSITYLPLTNTFKCTGKQTVNWSREKILASITTGAKWQRVFGDWFQANWATKKGYAKPLFSKIAVEFERIIEKHLRESGKLSSMLRFAEDPYFYASSTGLYLVPAIDTVDDLIIKRLRYGAPDGTSQLFIAEIGRPDSDNVAELDIYMRYANGMFACYPTARVQNLRNPEYIAWEKLV